VASRYVSVALPAEGLPERICAACHRPFAPRTSLQHECSLECVGNSPRHRKWCHLEGFDRHRPVDEEDDEQEEEYVGTFI